VNAKKRSSLQPPKMQSIDRSDPVRHKKVERNRQGSLPIDCDCDGRKEKSIEKFDPPACGGGGMHA
jgi:hypothetical protein